MIVVSNTSPILNLAIGLIGSLIEAKHNKVISLIKPILDNLVIEAGFWISDRLYSHVLKMAGE